MTTDDLRTTPGSVIPDEAQSDEAIRAWMADRADLRTRARVEAEERWPILTEPHSPIEWHDTGMNSGFVLGALWHAAQQPSDIWRQRVRSALTAALDEDELAGVIADHRMLPALGGTATGAWVGCSCGERITGWTRDHAQAQADRHLARALKEHLTKGTNDE